MSYCTDSYLAKLNCRRDVALNSKWKNWYVGNLIALMALKGSESGPTMESFGRLQLQSECLNSKIILRFFSYSNENQCLFGI